MESTEFNVMVEKEWLKHCSLQSFDAATHGIIAQLIQKHGKTSNQTNEQVDGTLCQQCLSIVGEESCDDRWAFSTCPLMQLGNFQSNGCQRCQHHLSRTEMRQSDTKAQACFMSLMHLLYTQMLTFSTLTSVV